MRKKYAIVKNAGVKLLPSLLPVSTDSIMLLLTDMTAVAEDHGSMAQFSVSTATPSGQLQHCTKNYMLTEIKMLDCKRQDCEYRLKVCQQLKKYYERILLICTFLPLCKCRLHLN